MELIEGSRKARVLVRNRLQSENVELLSQRDAPHTRFAKARSWNVRSHAAVGRKAAPIRGIGEDDRPKAS